MSLPIVFYYFYFFYDRGEKKSLSTFIFLRVHLIVSSISDCQLLAKTKESITLKGRGAYDETLPV